MLARRLRPERILRSDDWQLPALRGALVVVTHTSQTPDVLDRLLSRPAACVRAGLPAFAVISLVLSHLVSDVRARLLLQNLIPSFPATQRA